MHTVVSAWLQAPNDESNRVFAGQLKYWIDWNVVPFKLELKIMELLTHLKYIINKKLYLPKNKQT